MHNVGKAQHRLKDNPLERIFAEEWDKANISIWGHLDGFGVLGYILSDDPNKPDGRVSDRDRLVAATVIQWLGSPNGQGFLENTIARAKDEKLWIPCINHIPRRKL